MAHPPCLPTFFWNIIRRSLLSKSFFMFGMAFWPSSKLSAYFSTVSSFFSSTSYRLHIPISLSEVSNFIHLRDYQRVGQRRELSFSPASCGWDTISFNSLGRPSIATSCTGSYFSYLDNWKSKCVSIRFTVFLPHPSSPKTMLPAQSSFVALERVNPGFVVATDL